jgi:hypothetical protein
MTRNSPSATAEYKRMRRATRAINVQTHNRNGYKNGCRCDTCRTSYNIYMKDMTQARRRTVNYDS